MPNILAFAETRNNAPRRVALEAVTAARQLAQGFGGGEVHAVLAGASGIGSHAARLGEHGADVVHVAEHAALKYYNPEALAAACADLIRRGGYRAAVFPASAQGKDLAPRVAAKLGVPLAGDVLKMSVEGDALVVKHPVNAGKVIATLTLRATPAIVSIRPNSFTPASAKAAGRAETLALPADPAASRVKVVDMKEGGSGKVDLGEARIVIAGGRGLKAPENFKLVEELADAFQNAAVGCTRAVSDEGWRPHSDQIGQTGRNVSPELYVAVGISGAIQHLAGMRNSRTIVAINRDKDAPIFKIADYGIVGDAFEIVPALTEAVRAARSKH